MCIQCFPVNGSVVSGFERGKCITQSDFAAMLVIYVNDRVASEQRYITLINPTTSRLFLCVEPSTCGSGAQKINPCTAFNNKILCGVPQIIVIKCLFSAVINIYYHFTV